MHTEIKLLPDAGGGHVHSYGVMHAAEDTQAERLANSESLWIRENKQMLEQTNASPQSPFEEMNHPTNKPPQLP